MNRLQSFWNEYGLETLFVAAIGMIAILSIFNWMAGQKGTYNQPVSCTMINSFPQSTEIDITEDGSSKLERQAREILESIFQVPFTKIRPRFLRNEVTGQNLEIDLYNHSLRLGVEVNGEQHYKFVPYFHRTRDEFVKQRYRDEMKKMKCKEVGITLIEVPYRVGERGIRPYLLAKLREAGYRV